MTAAMPVSVWRRGWNKLKTKSSRKAAFCAFQSEKDALYNKFYRFTNSYTITQFTKRVKCLMPQTDAADTDFWHLFTLRE